MRYYQITIGTESFSIMQPNLKEAKQLSQWLKMTKDLKGKTSVKFIGLTIKY